MKLNELKESERIKISLLKYLFVDNKRDIIVVPEVSVFNSVADMLSIDKEIHIYEIKSAKDTFQRLKSQIESYSKCAHKITLVLDEKFLPKLDKVNISDNIGVISVNNRYKLTLIKEAKLNIIEKDSFMTHWSPIEMRETLRGFPQWYKYSTNEAKNKILEILNEDQLKRLTIFRLKEKYRVESYKRRKAIKNKDYEIALKSRFDDLESLDVTPLLDVPSSVFIDFITS